MIIAVISDLHDNVVAWKSIVKYLSAHKITRLINCGDTCAPDMLKAMSNSYAGRIDTVFGNVADRELEKSVVKSLKNVAHHGDQGSVTIAGQKIFFNHFPAAAEAAAKTGEYDIVCHGHTHLKRWEPSPTLDKTNNYLAQSLLPNQSKVDTIDASTKVALDQPNRQPVTMILNPGTAGGMFQYPSFATVDLKNLTCSFIDINV